MLYVVRLCFFTVLLFASFSSLAQKPALITGDFKGITFKQFVHKIETTTGCHFYYDASELDSFIVNVKANQTPLKDLLNQIFQSTTYHIAIDSHNHVFISKRYKIQTSLPDDFFEQKKFPQDRLTNNDLSLSEDPEKEDRLKSSIENRLFEIGGKSSNLNRTPTLTGYVRDAKNGEALVGAAVYIDTPLIGVISDQFGYYTISLPRGRYVLRVSSVGMKDTRRQIMLYGDGKLNVDMHEYVASLKEVILVSERHSNIRSITMGVEKLNIKVIKKVPVVFGETDILKVVLALPGVTSVGEASTGFHVRGGSADQNLILFDDATVYNPSHLFGFFTAFNADVVKGVELYKSAIPESYGGRLSSVLDVTTREGNNKKFSGNVGIGPLTGKLTIEGPIVKDKSSFILSGRTTYSNWLLQYVPDKRYRNSRASFYDLNLNINHTINSKNNLYLMAYRSKDAFNLNTDTVYKYSNTNVNAKWKRVFTNKLYGVLTAGYDRYEYAVLSTHDPLAANKLAFDINQTHGKVDFNYSPTNKHNLNFGLQTIYYKLNPGSTDPLGGQSLVIRDTLPSEQALETALYIGDRYTVNSNLSINAGLRFSLFSYLGPRDVYSYVPGLPRERSTIQDTTIYNSGKFIQNYNGPEIRLSGRYAFSDNSSVKISYNTLRQYIHMLSNSTAITPTDIWKLSDPNIKPQNGFQVSLGFYKNFRSNSIETSVEVYYKSMKNFLDYKSGAKLIMNHHIETDAINTRGKAYGAEFMLKKPHGKLNGWMSYTYSRTWLKMDDPLAGELINKGQYYPASFDKPHNVNFIGNYKFSHRYGISISMVYNTGRPITLPLATFNLGGSQRLYYSERNQYRIPDYFRADLSVNIEGNHKIKKLTHNSWSFGVYNLTGRQNAYSVFFVQENGVIKGYKLSIFGTQIPFITYNCRF